MQQIIQGATLPNYRYIGLTPRFYPDERGADGRSLMAEPGMVRDWEHTPDDGLWALEGDAPAAPVFHSDLSPEMFREVLPPEPEPEPSPDRLPAPEDRS